MSDSPLDLAPDDAAALVKESLAVQGEALAQIAGVLGEQFGVLLSAQDAELSYMEGRLKSRATRAVNGDKAQLAKVADTLATTAAVITGEQALSLTPLVAPGATEHDTVLQALWNYFPAQTSDLDAQAEQIRYWYDKWVGGFQSPLGGTWYAFVEQWGAAPAPPPTDPAATDPTDVSFFPAATDPAATAPASPIPAYPAPAPGAPLETRCYEASYFLGCRLEGGLPVGVALSLGIGFYADEAREGADVYEQDGIVTVGTSQRRHFVLLRRGDVLAGNILVYHCGVAQTNAVPATYLGSYSDRDGWRALIFTAQTPECPDGGGTYVEPPPPPPPPVVPPPPPGALEPCDCFPVSPENEFLAWRFSGHADSWKDRAAAAAGVPQIASYSSLAALIFLRQSAEARIEAGKLKAGAGSIEAYRAEHDRMYDAGGAPRPTAPPPDEKPPPGDFPPPPGEDEKPPPGDFDSVLQA